MAIAILARALLVENCLLYTDFVRLLLTNSVPFLQVR